MSDQELTEIAIDALKKIGVTDQNQFRLDIHNSTKQKHIHFVVNRIDIQGRCTVKSHKIGEKFGEAVREICKERNLKTDVEIGIEKKAEMLANLTESLKDSKNFDELLKNMSKKGFDVQLSSNIKDGISGMRIIMEIDKNHHTERQYKSGYTLSEISNKLKVSEIKMLFEIKQSVLKNKENCESLNDLRQKLQGEGLKMKVQCKGEFKPNQKNEVQDIWINKLNHSKTTLPKDGLFYNKYDGFSLSEIDKDFDILLTSITTNEQIKSSLDIHNSPSMKGEDSILEIAGDLLEDVLKPSYVSPPEDELWKKKRKTRR